MSLRKQRKKQNKKQEHNLTEDEIAKALAAREAEGGAFEEVKEAEVIKEEEERRQNQFAIEQYNRNRPVKDHVKDMAELNRALLDGEIFELKNQKKKK